MKEGWLTHPRLHLALLLDQQSTLFPPPSAAFSSFPDVIDRLLPYHIWQIQDDELEGQKKGKKRELRGMFQARSIVLACQHVDRPNLLMTRRNDRSGDHDKAYPRRTKEIRECSSG